MNEMHLDAIFSAFALLLVISWFFSFYQFLVIDAVRQRLFEIRDRNFVRASRLGLFEQETYREFRRTLNAMIELTQGRTILRYVVLSLAMPDNVATTAPRFIKTDAHFAAEMERAIEVVLVGMAARSPFTAVFFYVSLGGLWIAKLVNKAAFVRRRKAVTSNVRAFPLVQKIEHRVEADTYEEAGLLAA